MSDVKLTTNGVLIEGRCGVNEPKPSRDLQVTGSEVHSGGGGAGFSFGDRGVPGFVDTPTAGERWVWYSTVGSARLWSGKDVLSVTPQGECQFLSVSTNDLTPMRLYGRKHPVQGSSVGSTVWVMADRITLSRQRWNNTTKHLESYTEDGQSWKNVALAHTEGDKLVLNLDQGYTGGVEIQGAVNCPSGLRAAGHDVAVELISLKQQIADLKAQLKDLKKAVGK